MFYEDQKAPCGVVEFSPANELIISNSVADGLMLQNSKTPTASKPQWFAGLNSIRFVLAFIVVLSHCENPIQAYLRDSSIKLFQYVGMFLAVSYVGVAAVIAFFVISGFVIHYPNKNGIRDIKKFYIKRFFRVLGPLLVIMLLGTAFGNPERDVVWSLYCELIYYAIYPMLADIKLSWRSKLLISFALSAVVIIVAGRNDITSMLTQADHNYSGEFWQFGVGLTWAVGLPCWLLGVNLAERIDGLQQRVATQKLWLFRIVLFFASIVCCVLRFHNFVPYSVSMVLLAIPVAKWLEMEIVYYKTNKPVPTLENFGKFSYSLYLCHPILIAALRYVLPLNNYTYFVYLSLCIAGAYLFYLLLEKPAHMMAERMASVFAVAKAIK